MYKDKIQAINKNDLPTLLKDRYMLEAQALQFPALHFLFEIFDRKLQQYIEADLINFNTRRWQEANDPHKFQQYKEPFAVLTLGELEAGFVLCIMPIILSILMFGIEWMRTLKDLFVFIFIFKTYFRIKKQEQSEHSEFMRIKITT